MLLVAVVIWEAEDVTTDDACICLRPSLMLLSLSMESLAGSGYRAVTEDDGAPGGRLASLSHTGHKKAGFETSYQRHWGSKGLRPQSVMAMSISCFQKIWVRHNGCARWQRVRDRYSVVITLVHGRRATANSK